MVGEDFAFYAEKGAAWRTLSFAPEPKRSSADETPPIQVCINPKVRFNPKIVKR